MRKSAFLVFNSALFYIYHTCIYSIYSIRYTIVSKQNRLMVRVFKCHVIIELNPLMIFPFDLFQFSNPFCFYLNRVLSFLRSEDLRV